MPVAATDLTTFSSANTPINDTGTSGGARSTTSRPTLSQWSANAVAAVISDGADTRTVTITGRLATGEIDTENLVLNGAAEVVGAKTWERVHSAVIDSTSGTRTVTVRQGSGGTTRATIGINETTAHIFFQRSASEAASVERFEKMFWHNKHGTLALNAAKVTLTADPESRIRIGLASAKDDSGSATNRKTAPGGVTFSDNDVELSVPGSGNLAAGEAIGVWVEEDLLADDAPKRSTFTTRLAGTTT